MAKTESYLVTRPFHCGDLKLEEHTEVVFEGNRVTIDGEVAPKTANLRAAIKTGWLKPIDGTEITVKMEDPARSRYEGVVTTHEDDMVVGSATERNAKRTVVQHSYGAEAQAELEAQSADAQVVGSVTQDKLDEMARRLKGGGDRGTSSPGAGYRDTRTQEQIEADVAAAQAKRTQKQAARKQQAEALDAKNAYPVDAHWKTRVSWLKENANKSMIKRVAQTSTPSFVKTLQKNFPEAFV